MKLLNSVKGEFLNIFKTKKLLIAIIAILFIPLIYAGSYLWAFWDPYGRVDHLPVAVVNQDKGAVYEGRQLKIGDELADKLKEKKTFDWHFVSPEQAERGLQNQNYYLKIVIPKDFSRNAATLQSEHPKNLELIYTPNEGANYLTSKIGDSAIEKLKEEISGEVTKTYAEAMFANIKDVSKGLKDAGDGAGELHKGIDSAKNGADKIDKGLNSVKTGAGSLQSGINTALSGSKQLNGGISQVKDGTDTVSANLKTLAEKSLTFTNGLEKASAGAADLSKGLSTLNGGFTKMKSGQSQLLAASKKVQEGTHTISAGADKLASSTAEWKKGADQTAEGSKQVTGGLSELQAQIEALSKQSTDPAEKAKLDKINAQVEKLAAGSSAVDQGLNSLSAGAGRIGSGADSLAAGASGADEGQSRISDGLAAFGEKIEEAQAGADSLESGGKNLSAAMTRLAAGSRQLKGGTERLAEGAGQLSGGLENLSGGSNELVKGMTKLSDGGSSLLKGIGQLNGGSGNLVNGMDKLSAGAQELQGKLNDGSRETEKVKANDGVYNMFAKPVQVKETQLHHVPNYGTGFAPYFLPLSLFVGSLVVSVIYPLRKPAVMPAGGLSWFGGKAAVLLLVGIGQAVLADIALLGLLGLEVQSIPLFILLSILTSWTFLAIVQFLVTSLDNPGRFLAILILVLQLISSAGTYPIELVPSILQKAAQFLPMTYAVAGFRSVISTGDFDFMWHNAAILSAFFSAAALLTALFFTWSFKRGSHLQEQNA
ncbi:YhgE/Pip family protein [Peribacillus sp. SCS-37]|uniref:YhgE/Pip family protein n=1 Tax=Paraperibacillus esterisolvens TaxID=3115296 RepID=UPI003906B806